MIGFKLEVVEKNFQNGEKGKDNPGRKEPADFVDRLHSRTTGLVSLELCVSIYSFLLHLKIILNISVFILALFFSIVGLHFYGNPIDCITPKQVDGMIRIFRSY